MNKHESSVFDCHVGNSTSRGRHLEEEFEGNLDIATEQNLITESCQT